MTLIFKKSTAQPQFSGTPAISGTLQVGQTLTATDGSPTRVKEKAVAWISTNANGDVESEETLVTGSYSYTLLESHLGRRIKFRVLASNPAGTVLRDSELSAVVTEGGQAPPPIVVTPSAVTGLAEVGGELTVTYDFSGEDTIEIQWFRYTDANLASPVPIGTASTYTLTVDDYNFYIDCVVTAENTYGQTPSRSNLVGRIAPASSGAPSVISAAVLESDEFAAGVYEGEYLVTKFSVAGATSEPVFTWYKCDAGKQNPVELVDAAEAPIKPLPISEPGTYWSYLFLDRSLGLNSGNKRVYCSVVASNGAGSTPASETAESAAVGPIQGTAITQAMVGDGPYDITAAGTYYLDEDITVPGSGLFVKANGVTINLNGYELTYDNETPVTIPNGDFEAGTGPNGPDWDFTGAGGSLGVANTDYIYVVRGEATPEASAELNATNARLTSEGSGALHMTAAACSGSLDPVVSVAATAVGSTGLWTTGTANPFVEDDAVHLTAMTGGSGAVTTPLQLSAVYFVRNVSGDTFELWTKPTYLTPQGHKMEGFADVTSSTLVKSTHRYVDSGTFTCNPDTWYALSFVQFYTPKTLRASVYVEVLEDGVSIGGWWRPTIGSGSGVPFFYGWDPWHNNPSEGCPGFQSVMFKASDATYRIRVGVYSITGRASTSMFDDFRVTCGYRVGISKGFSASSWNDLYLGKTFTNGTVGCRNGLASQGIRYSGTYFNLAVPDGVPTTVTNAPITVKNGLITQGQSGGVCCTNVSGGSINASHIRTHVHGPVSRSFGNGSSTTLANMADIQATSDDTLAAQREEWPNQQYYQPVGTMKRCSLLGGCGPMMRVGQGALLIEGCSARINARTTNQFGIVVRSATSLLTMRDSIIDNTGEYFGRGITLNAGGSAQISNSYIAVQPSPWNREYGGYYPRQGDYALQLEGAGASDVYGCTIRAEGNGPVLGSRPCASAVRANGNGGSPINIYNNVIEAFGSGEGTAICIFISFNALESGLNIHSNILNTNAIVWCGARAYRTHVSNSQINYYLPAAVEANIPVVSYTGTSPVWYLDLRDCPLNSDAESRMVTETPRYQWDPFRWETQNRAVEGEMRRTWTITFATGAQGDVITVRDKDGKYAAVGDGFMMNGTVSDNTLRLPPDIYDDKPFMVGDKVVLRTLVGGSGLVEGQIYYVVAATPPDVSTKTLASIQISETAGGEPASFVDNVSRVVVSAVEGVTGASGAVDLVIAQSTHTSLLGVQNWNATGSATTGYTVYKNGSLAGLFTADGNKTVNI